MRPPAVAEPWSLHPGDRPPIDEGRVLLMFDGGCGICLHARDAMAVLDSRDRLRFDRIARHDRGLLADLDEETRYGSWHVFLPDGRRLDGADGLIEVMQELPATRLAGRALGHVPGLADAGYRWFARNRSWISQGSGLIEHPQRDPREQPGEPGHDALVARLTTPG